MPLLSIVMPAYNEGEHIEECVREWHAAVISKIPGSELVVVDDCSRDDTEVRLRALTSHLPGLHVLRTPRNGGHGRAVRYGLDHCTGEFVFQTDSDRQHFPEDFWNLWKLRNEADFVFGCREQRADGAFRRGVSFGLRLCNAFLWGAYIRDANCPFKLMRASALSPVLRLVPPDAFIPMVMVSILSRHLHFSVTEVPVRHLPRTAGEQSLKGLKKWVRVAGACTKELLDLRLSTLTKRASGQRVARVAGSGR